MAREEWRRVREAKEKIYAINVSVCAWRSTYRTARIFKTNKVKIEKIFLMCCLERNSVNL